MTRSLDTLFGMVCGVYLKLKSIDSLLIHYTFIKMVNKKAPLHEALLFFCRAHYFFLANAALMAARSTY